MRLTLGVVVSVVALGCGGGMTQIGGAGGGSASGGGSAGDGGPTGGGSSSGGGASSGGGSSLPACVDNDNDGVTNCQLDCNDADPNVKPGAMETKNSVDDDCDGKVDNHIAGQDADMDGTPYPADCNDDEPLVGPNAIEDAMNKVDDNCNGMVDEAIADCDAAATGTTPAAFASAIGACSPMAATTPAGAAGQRSIRAKFGEGFTPRSGTKMVMLSTGQAVDQIDMPTYQPQPGTQFASSVAHPLYSPPRCAAPIGTPPARDMAELRIQLKVPQNAKNVSFNFAFFSAEYPEWVCTEYNDRFIAILESEALVPSMLPARQCLTGTAKPTCNVSYDDKGQPVSINNGFFDICDSASGGTGANAWTNTCTKPATMMNKTGYEVTKYDDETVGNPQRRAGGSTGWLTTTAPVKPNETITLRFIVLDEGDARLDSAVLLDNLKWGVTAVSAPVTVDPGIN